MIEFKPIKSGSSGNCYLVTSNGESIVIEAGISWKQLRHCLNFKTSILKFVLISHSHSDHSCGLKDVLRAGIDVFTSEEVAKSLNVSNHHRINILKVEVQEIIGTWTVLPFKLTHDVSCIGFFISHGVDRLLFIPDTAYVENKFERVTMISVECNYISEILSKNILNGSIPAVVGHRIRRNHMSLDNLIEMLKSNDLSRLREVWLLHLSDGNSDELLMVKRVQESIGVPVYVAQS